LSFESKREGLRAFRSARLGRSWQKLCSLLGVIQNTHPLHKQQQNKEERMGGGAE